MTNPLSGAQALALGSIEAGVSLVTGYPGSPATAVVNAILELASPQDVQAEWNINEKVAAEMAFGASLAGTRSLLCVKSVGFNLALDPLMTINLAGCNAGLVVLIGDDPGGWSSQNEQDSRTPALATELPILEPTTISDAVDIMRHAFQLSEDVKLPIIVRVTKPLVLAETSDVTREAMKLVPSTRHSGPLKRTVVLPVEVVKFHHRLHLRLDEVRNCFEDSPFNRIEGEGPFGVIASGFVYQKLIDLLDGKVPTELRILRLATTYPLPENNIQSFLHKVKAALVLEETIPLVERAVRDAAQKSGLTMSIYGRDTGNILKAGELDASQIASSLNHLSPGLDLPVEETGRRPMPSKVSLDDQCPYIPTFNALFEGIEKNGSRENTIMVGDPGCMVRGQERYDLMDIKTSLGSSIGIATGVSLSLSKDGMDKRVVALSGDSSFLHSNFHGLVDAVQMGAKLFVLILDNDITALSGGQPHPGTRKRDQTKPGFAVDIAALARAAGAGLVEMVDLDKGGNIQDAIERGLNFDGLAVVIARGSCPDCPSLKR